MNQIVWLLRWTNKNYDHQLTALAKSLLASSCVIRTGWQLAVTTGQVDTWEAFILCTRTNGQKVMVHYENTEAVVIVTTGTKKVWIGVDQSKLDDGSANALDGSGIASIQTGASYPSSNYIPLASITGGVITDARVFVDTLDKKLDVADYQNGTKVYAATSSWTDTYAITLSPVPASYLVGMSFKFLSDVGNTGAASLNVNGLWAKIIKKLRDQDLASGDIEAGQLVTVSYDGTNFQMDSQIATIPTVDVNGLAEDTEPDMDGDFDLEYDTSAGANRKRKMAWYRATNAEAQAQSLNTKFVTPANLASVTKMSGLIFPLLSQDIPYVFDGSYSEYKNLFWLSSQNVSTDWIYACLDTRTTSAPYSYTIKYIDAKKWILKFSNNFYWPNIADWNSATCCKIWDYVYAAINGAMKRVDKVTLANLTTMTLSWSTLDWRIFTDWTYLYSFNSSSIKKWSISWTTATYISATTFTGLSVNFHLACDWTYVYWLLSTDNIFYRWPMAGGAYTALWSNFSPYSTQTSRTVYWILLDPLYWQIGFCIWDSDSRLTSPRIRVFDL